MTRRGLVRAVLPLLLAGGALSSCAGDRKGDPKLAVACALKPCECTPDGAFASGDAEPVLWRENGDAYCREGYALRLSDSAKYAPREKPTNRQPGGIGVEFGL